jgi:hypothetical protein
VGSRPSIGASLAATTVAAAVSGAPSTVHSLTTGRPVLATVRAAAALVPTRRTGGAPAAPPSPVRDLAAGSVAHAAVSLFWGEVLTRVLPPGRRAVWGAAAGVGIYVLDLGVIARLPRLAPMRRLPQLPQLADHIAFAATVGFLLDHFDDLHRVRADEAIETLQAIDAVVHPERDDGPAPGGTGPSLSDPASDQAP